MAHHQQRFFKISRVCVIIGAASTLVYALSRIFLGEEVSPHCSNGGYVPISYLVVHIVYCMILVMFLILYGSTYCVKRSRHFVQRHFIGFSIPAILSYFAWAATDTIIAFYAVFTQAISGFHGLGCNATIFNPSDNDIYSSTLSVMDMVLNNDSLYTRFATVMVYIMLIFNQTPWSVAIIITVALFILDIALHILGPLIKISTIVILNVEAARPGTNVSVSYVFNDIFEVVNLPQRVLQILIMSIFFAVCQHFQEMMRREQFQNVFSTEKALLRLQIPEIDVEQLAIKASQKIGAGGEGQIFVGVYADHDVAVKVMYESLISCEQKYADMAREVTLLSTLRHPHLITLYGVCPKPFTGIVMELCKSNLKSVVTSEKYRKKLQDHICNDGSIFSNLFWAREVIKQISAGIQYLHTQGIIHADIKCANILVKDDDIDKKPDIRIIDLGIAKFQEQRQVVGEISYTPGYSPPEVVIAANSKDNYFTFTTSIDVWSMGIGKQLHFLALFCWNICMYLLTLMTPLRNTFVQVIWEIYHGRAPFESIDPVVLNKKIVEGLMPDFETKELRSHATMKHVRELIQLCLHPETIQRPNFEYIASAMAYTSPNEKRLSSLEDIHKIVNPNENISTDSSFHQV